MKYDYKCKKCHNVHEGEAKITDNTCPPCPECGGETAKTFRASAPVHFSGGGWAKDGYGSKR